MTNQEAIKWLREAEILDLASGNTKDREAVDMAISALQAQDLQPTCNQLATNVISRQAAIDVAKDLIIPGADYLQNNQAINNYVAELVRLPSAQPELIEQGAYVRGFEQGRTQGMIDAQGEKKMSRQRKVVITMTYNDLGIIIDTKAEELDLSAQPEPHWIPCSERLPDEETDVLVTRTFLGCKDGGYGNISPNTYVEVAQYFNGRWTALSDEYKVAISRHTDPVAWMPLPESYREECGNE